MSRWLAPLLATLIAFAYFFLRVHYPWQLALLSGLSIGALTYVARRTVDQMRWVVSSGVVVDEESSEEDS